MWVPDSAEGLLSARPIESETVTEVSTALLNRRFLRPSRIKKEVALQVKDCKRPIRSEVRVRAQRTKFGDRIWHANHGDRSCFVFAVEGCGLRGIESAILSFVGVAEPKSHVERVGWC